MFIDNEAYMTEVIDRFTKEVSLGHSVDWYLIKLSSAISIVEEIAKQMNSSAIDLVKKFLNDEKVKSILQNIACYDEEVRVLISSNPRFRNLRPYIEYIIEVLQSLPCTNKNLQVSREPTWKIESFESRRAIKKQRFKVDFIKISEKIALIIGIAAIIIAVLVMLL